MGGDCVWVVLLWRRCLKNKHTQKNIQLHKKYTKKISLDFFFILYRYSMEHFEKEELIDKELEQENTKEVIEIDEELRPLPEGSVAQPDPPINKKKKKRVLTEEHKAKLREGLKKAREKSMAVRQAKGKQKKIQEVKKIEAEETEKNKDKIEKEKEKERLLEEKIEKRLKAKYENEYNLKSKDTEIQILREQLSRNYSHTPVAVPTQAEKAPKKEEPKSVKYNVNSPFKNTKLIDRYKNLYNN